LQNTGGYKVGVVINDVASVNIDAKYILSSSTAAAVTNTTKTTNQSITTPLSSLLLESSDVVELQNGCACCSLSDELLSSIQTLLTLNNTDDNNPQPRNLDAIVVELSGVADPMAIKQRWTELDESASAPTILRLTNISRVVTLVDSSTFGFDYMSWNTAGDREGWRGNKKNNNGDDEEEDEEDECSANRKISELLVEQLEAADTIVINKVDLTTADQVSLVTQVTRGLNTAAQIYETHHGKVPHHMILGNTDSTITNNHHHHPSNHHNHDHSHRSVSTSTTTTTTTTTTTACSDPTCTDPTHDHSTHHNHDHNSISSKNTSLKNLGIGSFVFKASVPFHSGRLMDLLNRWPVPVKDTLDVELLQEASRDGYAIREQKIFGNSIHKESIISPFVGVLRSKGFCWLAPTSFTEYDLWRHDTAMYWSHAGKHFSITAAGKWWGSLSKEQMKTYFEERKNPREYNRILTEDFLSEEWGDRRQELVFIGTNLNETKISSSLQACLLSTDEMKVYREQLKGILPDGYIPQ
jgi:G3E family GTPase